MKLKDIYPLLSSREILLYDISANKVHSLHPESIKAILYDMETLSTYGEYNVARIIPLDFQELQITIKKRGMTAWVIPLIFVQYFQIDVAIFM